MLEPGGGCDLHGVWWRLGGQEVAFSEEEDTGRGAEAGKCIVCVLRQSKPGVTLTLAVWESAGGKRRALLT